MLERFITALALALLGLVARTSVTSAALLSDRDDVMIATSAAAIILMAVLLGIYLIKHAFGLDHVLPPPETDASGHGHH